MCARISGYRTPFQLVFWQALLATAILSALALAFDGVPLISWTPELAGAFLYGAIFGTALAHWAVVMVNREPAGRHHLARPAGDTRRGRGGFSHFSRRADRHFPDLRHGVDPGRHRDRDHSEGNGAAKRGRGTTSPPDLLVHSRWSVSMIDRSAFLVLALILALAASLAAPATSLAQDAGVSGMSGHRQRRRSQ